MNTFTKILTACGTAVGIVALAPTYAVAIPVGIGLVLTTSVIESNGIKAKYMAADAKALQAKQLQDAWISQYYPNFQALTGYEKYQVIQQYRAQQSPAA